MLRALHILEKLVDSGLNDWLHVDITAARLSTITVTLCTIRRATHIGDAVLLQVHIARVSQTEGTVKEYGVEDTWGGGYSQLQHRQLDAHRSTGLISETGTSYDASQPSNNNWTVAVITSSGTINCSKLMVAELITVRVTPRRSAVHSLQTCWPLKLASETRVKVWQ